MIKTFNIYGERNSGTNFLYELISNNFDLKGSVDKKHSLVKEYNKSEDHINFCIIRNLNDWIYSMYLNPYHINNDYRGGVKRYRPSRKKDVYTFCNENVITNLEDPSPYDINLSGKYNLVEIRYLKYNSYKNITNKVLVNLDFLQKYKKNKVLFLDSISKKYNLEKKKYDGILKTVGGQGSKKRYRSTNFSKPFYPKLKLTRLKSYNEEIENEINNISFII